MLNGRTLLTATLSHITYCLQPGGLTATTQASPLVKTFILVTHVID